jgi:ABC-type uncharacterized transport system YnjBCD ATPase subunit
MLVSAQHAVHCPPKEQGQLRRNLVRVQALTAAKTGARALLFCTAPRFLASGCRRRLASRRVGVTPHGHLLLPRPLAPGGLEVLRVVKVQTTR